VRWIVGFAAGGPQDIVARLMAQILSERLGQQFVIENRAGAGGNIGTEAAVRAPADGYTILMIGPSATINVTLYEGLSFNLLTDIAPVAGIMRTSNVMEVHPSLPVKTVPEFIAYAKANRGKINMASAGNGSQQHVAGELFKMMAGVNLVHVPYRGNGPALTDLLGGQVQVMFPSAPSSIAFVRAGNVRALAVTTAKRSPACWGRTRGSRGSSTCRPCARGPSGRRRPTPRGACRADAWRRHRGTCSGGRAC